MNTAPIRTEAILPRIDGITRNITKLRKLGTYPLEEFEKRDDVFDLSQHHLRLALEGVFHIGSHILARLPGSRVTSYKEITSNDLGDIEVFLVAIKDVLKDPEKFNLSIS